MIKKLWAEKYEDNDNYNYVSDKLGYFMGIAIH